jgi:hypothetical protein
MRFRALARGFLFVALGSLVMQSVPVSAQGDESPGNFPLTPAQVKTIALHRCGSATLSTNGATCSGFSAADILSDPSIFLVGFENNTDVNEKHVLQTVVEFDLSQVTVEPDSEVDFASLMFSEVSTTRRSPSGESEYGILQSCNTKLGVPVNEWDGRVDRLVPTLPALTAGMVPATTAESGTWDVLPQVKGWIASGQKKATFVLNADDQSADVREMAMCLSYLTDMSLTVQVSPKPE